MMREDFTKHIQSMLGQAIGGIRQSDIKTDYKEYLRLVQAHLRTLYGDKADWKVGIKRYYDSDQYKSQCRIARRIEDIPVIDISDLERMMSAESEYENQIKRLMELNTVVADSEGICLTSWNNALIEMAGLLGIIPWESDSILNHCLVDFGALTDADIQHFKTQVSQAGYLQIIINVMMTEYEPGIQMTYPGAAGVVMLQQRSRNYYRGENAYYAKSQPSAYRHRINNLPSNLMQCVEDLRCIEASWMFLEFDAVKHWNLSTPNYWALGQHYGLWTNLMDITSSLKTALFFACCKYIDGKWLPLDKSDFENVNSRQYVAELGGDSRYGVLHTSPSEITAMQYGVNEEQAFHMITPVGYQPFMRCSAQNAYILAVNNPTYDMFKDANFSKVRFRLTEDLCNWIYVEMGQGEKIYPRNDVPYKPLSKVINEINSTHHFSKSTFNDFVKFTKCSENSAEELKKDLAKHGYHILPYDKKYFSYKEKSKLNKRYTLELANSLIPVMPKYKPMFTLYVNSEMPNEET